MIMKGKETKMVSGNKGSDAADGDGYYNNSDTGKSCLPEDSGLLKWLP